MGENGMAEAFDQAFSDDLQGTQQSPQPPNAPEQTAADRVAGETGVADGSQAQGTQGQQTQDAPAGGQEGQDADDRGPIPYERFQQVNSQKNNYQEFVQQLVQDPNAYRQTVIALTGRDPFGGGQGQGQQPQVDPVEQLLGPSLTRDDFATDVDYRAYTQQRQAMEQMFGELTSLKQNAQSTEQSNMAAARERALTEFSSVCGEIEKAMGIQLSPAQKNELRTEAALYGNALTVRQATVRAARHMLFDTAVQRGRQQGTDIRDKKESLGKPGGVNGPTAPTSESGAPLDTALEKAWQEHGD